MNEHFQSFGQGDHARIHHFLGAHVVPQGVRFAVWAPNAARVQVVGDFNDWLGTDLTGSAAGIWTGVVAEASEGQNYKFRVDGQDKADPVGFLHQCAPDTASVITRSRHVWKDQDWVRSGAPDQPLSIYELHLGSWCEGATYRSIAERLVEHVLRLGFTHVEFMPLNEHPFYGSWGYQVTGFFAPSARYGSPDDLRHLIDTLHQAGIGVLMDWVPAHFPEDAHGLAQFDGTHLFEHADPRRGFHPDWKTLIFNYGRNEVRSFLISSAARWIEDFHVDGLRVDAVASMLYPDYSRGEGEWLPNKHGGRENLEAVAFLKQLNERLHRDFPGMLMIAEESTAWPGVSKPTFEGGLGFDMKWDMGWMHDTLQYLQRDPIHRKHHHRELTFRGVYAHSEAFVLALSHDEVVHGKRALTEKFPGDDWQRRATHRALMAYQWAQPGKKLVFMGMELGQRTEWNHDGVLDWDNADEGLMACIADLNTLYRDSLHIGELSAEHTAWSGVDDAENSVMCFLRGDHVVVCNFTPIVQHGYRVGVSRPGAWTEAFNSDATRYGGSGVSNTPRTTEPTPWHGQQQSIQLMVPPLAVLVLR